MRICAVGRPIYDTERQIQQVHCYCWQSKHAHNRKKLALRKRSSLVYQFKEQDILKQNLPERFQQNMWKRALSLLQNLLLTGI